MSFFELEAGYIVLALFFLAITAFVTTRDFMPKGAFKKGMSLVGVIMFIAIISHYYITTSRMKEIEMAFNSGKSILCENRETLHGSISLPINKNAGWSLNGGIFSNPDYYRKFHSARCIIEKEIDIPIKK